MELRRAQCCVLALSACGPSRGSTDAESRPSPETIAPAPKAAPTKPVTAPTPAALDERRDERAAMVREQLMSRDIVDERVLAAMTKVPRHAFVPEELLVAAYDDRPLPIGHDVTISQPYIVALMTQLAEVAAGERVLDVGTGSGYQAAVLAELGAEVWGIEIIEEHAAAARERLERLGYAGVTVRHGDGHAGWREHAPFDAIIVAAAAGKVPQALLDQLAIGGRMVIPVGSGWSQSLELIVRTADGYSRRKVLPVMFVPLVGGE